jgi:light-regulated signal transduction histidine kinase (bacteriophytochrome)
MITTYSQLLVATHSQGENPEDARYLDYITNGTKRMRDLLADLLAYTEMAGQTEQPLETVNVSAVLQHAMETLSAQISETGAEIQVGNLPVVCANEGRMTSLFMNLLNNAIKYRSGASPQIRVWTETGEDEIVFAVADNGIGIAPEYRIRIFDAFKRLHGRDIPGTGIGLAICQRIVERYGGRIWVDSAVGTGSTFRFTLPISMWVQE